MWDLRGFVAVVLGYISLLAAAFSALTLAYIALGADRVFVNESHNISNLWIVVTLIGGLIGAMFGGYICRIVAASVKPAFVLAALIVLVAFTFGAYGLLFPVALEMQQGDVKMLNAMNVAVSPKWLVFVHGCVCCAGVLAGAVMIKTPKKN